MKSCEHVRNNSEKEPGFEWWFVSPASAEGIMTNPPLANPSFSAIQTVSSDLFWGVREGMIFGRVLNFRMLLQLDSPDQLLSPFHNACSTSEAEAEA